MFWQFLEYNCTMEVLLKVEGACAGNANVLWMLTLCSFSAATVAILF